MRLVELGRGEHDVPEADALGEEAAGYERRRVRRVRVVQPFDHLDRHSPRRRDSGQPVHPPDPALVVGTRGHLETSSAEAVDRAVERFGTDSLESDEDGVVRRPGFHHEPMGPVVVAPGDGASVARFARDQPDHVTEERREAGRVRNLDAEVGEFDLVVHVRPL